MKLLMLLILASALLPPLASAEYRTIAIEILRDTNQVVSVSIYSEVQAEQQTNTTVSNATEILKRAKGWGSGVGVAILTDGPDLREYMPILEAISGNGHLSLFTVTSRGGSGAEILKQHGIEQGGGEVRQTRGTPPAGQESRRESAAPHR